MCVCLCVYVCVTVCVSELYVCVCVCVCFCLSHNAGIVVSSQRLVLVQDDWFIVYTRQDPILMFGFGRLCLSVGKFLNASCHIKDLSDSAEAF